MAEQESEQEQSQVVRLVHEERDDRAQQWLEKWAWELTEGDRQAIRERAYTLIDQYPAHHAIPLDCHA